MLGVELRTTGKFFLDLDNCFCFHEVDGIACLPDWMRPSRLGITVDRIGRLSRDDRTTENSSDTRRSRRPYTSIRSTNDNRCEREKQPSTNVPSKRKLRLCPCFFFFWPHHRPLSLVPFRSPVPFVRSSKDVRRRGSKETTDETAEVETRFRSMLRFDDCRK